MNNTSTSGAECDAGPGSYVSPPTFYSDLTTAAQGDGFNYVIGNPGSDTTTAFIGSVNTMNIFENPYSTEATNATLNPSSTGCSTPSGITGWHLCYSKSNFSFLQYDESSSDLSSTLIKKLSNYVGFMFYTSVAYPYQWSYPPSQAYLEDELSPLSTSSALLTVDADNANTGAAVSGIAIHFYQPADQSCGVSPTTCDEVMQGTTAISGSAANIVLNGTEGWSYTVQAGTISGCTFDKWSTGATTTSISVSLTSSTTVTAEYTGSDCGSSVTVNSVYQNGDGLSGYDVDLYQDGTYITDGFTNATFGVTQGEEYTIFPQNYDDCAFSHWQDTGNIDAERSFTAAAGNQAFTAVYWCATSGSTAVTVQISDSSGKMITGYETVLYTSGGTEISSGFSTYTYTGLTSETVYKMLVDSYDGCDFDDWNGTGGSTANPISFTSGSTGTNVLLDATYTGSCD